MNPKNTCKNGGGYNMQNKIWSLQMNTIRSNNNENLKNVAVAGALTETVSRYGSAGAEFLKGLRGVDNETGQIFDRSLQKIATYKINPQNAQSNIKQQAGFSAEVASTSKRNAEAIINGDKNRFIRSEDLKSYGKKSQYGRYCRTVG